MRRECFQNDARTTLSADAGVSDTSLTVTDGSVFPSGGDFRLLIDHELVLCTLNSSNTLTVQRAQEGTTAATHSTGTNVSQVVTQGGLQRYLRDNDPLFDSLRAPYRIINASGNFLHAADFTLWDFGTGTSVVDCGGSIVMASPVGANLTRPIPSSSPWTLTAAGRSVSTNNAGLWSTFSVGVADTNNCYCAINYRAHEKSIHCNKWNNGAYVAPDIVSPFDACCGDWMWLRITDPNDGNWHFQISDNGRNFLEVGSFGKGAYLGTPNRLFWGTMNPASGGWVTLAAWDDGAGLLGS